MKKRSFVSFIILIALLLPFTYGGCSGGGGGDDGDRGTAPEISPVILLKIVDGVPTQTLSFDVGDIVNISVIATDPDLDMNTLFTTPYLAPDFDSPAEPDIELELPSQTDPTMEYFFNNFIEISEDLVGNWRLCFWIVDNAGNESNEFCVNLIINEAAGLRVNLNKSLAPEGVFDFSNETIEGEAVE